VNCTLSITIRKKIAAVGLLTQLHEKRVNGDGAWKMRDARKDFMKSKLDGIVELELHIKRLEAKSKLSQNKETTDYTSVVGKMGELRLMGLNKRMKSLIQK
jgi:transcriptional regulator